MRTTLTLDDDVAALLEQYREERDLRFKEAVNLALREGLVRLQKKRTAERTPYRTPSVDLGKPHLPSLDSISEGLASVEGESFL